ncbi:hypothetical protein IV203_028387 [Nitzschia inconspicua]|uniref:Membrane-associated protein n=1 Tax=Nitzschia inconspicua TaxID=303405 RepID=A0A9K3LPI1_9STRA|nr:hypothetical protein IV203_028387 [Nitzschia inconspicua]
MTGTLLLLLFHGRRWRVGFLPIQTPCLLLLLLLISSLMIQPQAAAINQQSQDSSSLSSIDWFVNQQKQQEQQQHHHHHRELVEAYTLYSLPKVHVELETKWTDELDRAYRLTITTTNTDTNNDDASYDSSFPLLISQTGQQQSSLSFPFRTVTQNYLYQGFTKLLSDWERTLPSTSTTATAGGEGGDTNITSSTSSSSPSSPSSFSSSHTFFPMYRHLVTVDVQVRLFVLRPSDPSLILDVTSVTLLAELTPSVAFLETTTTTPSDYDGSWDGGPTKPSDEQVLQLFGHAWMMDTLFSSSNNNGNNNNQNLVEYQQQLRSTTDPSWMGHIRSVHVTLALPYGPGGTAVTNDATARSGWSQRTENVMLSVLVLVIGGAGIVFVLAYRRQRRKYYIAQLQALHHGELHLHQNDVDDDDDGYRDEEEQENYRHGGYNHHPSGGVSSWRPRSVSDDLSQGDRSFVSSSTVATGTAGTAGSMKRPPPLTTRMSSLDSARHGTDVFHRTSTMNAMTALEASDRYLSKHRPDLYQYYNNNNSNNNQSSNNNNSSLQVFGRTYEIPSNPFDFIGGYFNFSHGVQQQQHQQAASAHFPFSPSAFASPNNGGSCDHRRSSFAVMASSPSTLSANSAFTPIPNNMNLAASAHQYLDQPPDDDDDEEEVGGRSNTDSTTTTTTRQGAHTGQSWQVQQQQQQQYLLDDDHSSASSAASSALGNIFRNLSISAWMPNSGKNSSNHNNNNNRHGRDDSRYHDDDDYGNHHQHHHEGYDDDDDLAFHHGNDPGDIELEDLPADYDFPFQDFPRIDGTPCLIYNEEALQERERQKRASQIFATTTTTTTNNDDNDNGTMDYDSGTEKKDDTDAWMRRRTTSSVSDSDFRKMLSDHSLDDGIGDNTIDPLLVVVDDADDDDQGKNGASSTPTVAAAKSPQFQQQLARLMETKQRRYAMEYKKEAIVQEQRKKRQNFREKQRLERHKAMERDLEEIEAEFLSPLTARVKQQQHQQQQQPPLSPKRGTTAAAAAASPMSKLVARSPILQRLGGVGGSGSVRHKKHNSLGASPFRRRGSGQHSLAASSSTSPGRITASRSGSGSSSGGIFRTSSHQEGESPSVVSSTYPSLPPSMLRRDDLTDFPQDNINPFIKDMPSALSGQDGIDLTLPSMSGRGQRQSSARDVGIAGSSVDTTKKYPSPQSLVEEAMQSTAKVVPTAAGSTGGRFPHIFGHRRTRTPTRPAGTNASSSVSVGHPNHHHRRINSMDVVETRTIDGSLSSISSSNAFARSPLKRSNSSHRRTGSSSSIGVTATTGTATTGTATTSGNDRYLRRSNSNHSLGGRRHRRSNSQSSHHRRSNSSNNKEEDIFLHGVVATTRFV